MKKKITILLLILVSTLSWGQIITTTPQFVTQGSGSVEVIFDASLGNGGLKDYAGTDVYAHTGVITTASSSNSDWKHAPTWLDNSAKYKLSSLGNNKWKFNITPSIGSFYSLTTGEVVTKLAFVFRNETGSVQGKDVGNADIYVDVFQTGLNVAFGYPNTNQSLAIGSSLEIRVGSSVAADLNLIINGSSVKTATASTSLTFSYTFSSAIDYTLIAEANLNGDIKRDTIRICVPTPATTEARPMGLKDGINIVNDSTATFILYAPGKSNIFLIGDFNNWIQLNAYQMKKDGDYWWETITGLKPNEIYGFQYLVDGNLKVSDPYTEMVLDPWNDKWINQNYSIYPNLKSYPVGKTDGLVATVQTSKKMYNWEVNSFIQPSTENLVIYELLLRDFTKEKSLEAAITKLDYLKNLGINAIELMPIQEFDGNNSWGYNPNHYFAADKAYGTPETYKKFIDECHKRGIAVILDMVFNQASGSCPFAMLYWDVMNNRPSTENPWMNPIAPHPYSVFNDFNHSFPGTKEYFKRVLKYWLTEYKVDGYRMDLTKGLTQTNSTESNASNYDQTRIDNLSTYYNAAKEAKSDVIFILEHFCGNAEETELANKGMFLWRNTNNAYSQAAMGYQSESSFAGMITTPQKWIGYAESHDEERNFYKAKTYGAGDLKTDSITRISRVPLLMAFNILLPGPKMIWEFGEMGYDYSINSNGGRTNEKPSAWEWLNLPHRKEAYKKTAKIINLRKLYPTAFSQGLFDYNISASDWTGGKKISLSHSDLNLIVIGNFDAINTINMKANFQKTGKWYNLMTSEEINVKNTSMDFSLSPGQLSIFTDRKIDLPIEINDSISEKQLRIYPTLASDIIYISTSSSVKSVKIYNMQGSLLLKTEDKNEINIQKLKSGLYLVEVQTLTKKSILKIIKI